MYIDGRWLAEPEIEAYIKRLRREIAELRDKHENECRQISEYEIETNQLRELRRLVYLTAKYAGKSEDVCEQYLPSIDGDLCVTDGMGASNCTCCGYEYRCDYKN